MVVMQNKLLNGYNRMNLWKGSIDFHDSWDVLELTFC